MKKNNFCLRIIMLALLVSTPIFPVQTSYVKVINGVPHVYNKATLENNVVTLLLKKDVTIQTGQTGNNTTGSEEFFFDDFDQDAGGNIYLLDGNSVKIHKFDKKGTYIKTFLRKGEGPGEFGPYPGIQVIKGNIFIIGEREKKISRYDLNGKYLDEHCFKSFYYNIKVIDDNRFIANKDTYSTVKATDFTRAAALYTLAETKIIEFLEADKAGRFFVPYGKQSIAIIPGPQVIPNIIYAVDISANRLYISLNKDYQVYARNMDGKIEAVFHKENQNAPLNQENKLEIASSFGQLNDALKKSIISGLPSNLCAFEKIDVLPHGHLLVRHITAYQKIDFDIFTKEGKFVCSVKLPGNLHLENVKFYNGSLCGIENQEDTVIFYRYNIDSLPEIFGQQESF